MKKKRISTYITLLTLLSSMLLYSPTLAAQEKNNHRGRKGTLLSGTTIGVDIFGLGSKIFGGDITSTEISVEVNLKTVMSP